MSLNNLIPPGLQQNQEFTIPIEQWYALTAKDKSEFLSTNRLFLTMYVKDKKQIITTITFCKHADSTVIKKTVKLK